MLSRNAFMAQTPVGAYLQNKLLGTGSGFVASKYGDVMLAVFSSVVL